MAQTPFQNTRALDSSALSITPLGSVTIVANEDFSFQTLAQSGVMGQISNIQSVFVDASQIAGIVTILNQKTRQFVRWPAGACGWNPILIGTDATQVIIRCAAAGSIGLAVSTYPFYGALTDMGRIRAPVSSIRSDVAATAASVTLLAANVSRTGFTIYNDSSVPLRVLLNGDLAASALNFTLLMQPGAYFESLPDARYGGEVRGFWGAAIGGARMTEFQ